MVYRIMSLVGLRGGATLKVTTNKGDNYVVTDNKLTCIRRRLMLFLFSVEYLAELVGWLVGSVI